MKTTILFPNTNTNTFKPMMMLVVVVMFFFGLQTTNLKVKALECVATTPSSPAQTAVHVLGQTIFTSSTTGATLNKLSAPRGLIMSFPPHNVLFLFFESFSFLFIYLFV